MPRLPPFGAPHHLTRRDVLSLAAGVGALGCLGASSAASGQQKSGASATELITRPIPSSAEKIPVVGLGTNNYSPATPEERATRRQVLEHMPELGGKVVDTAPAYRQSEVTLGELLAELGNRKRFFLATKVTAPGNDVEQGRAMIAESLRRLRTESFDLLQVHNMEGVDVLMPVLREGKAAGKFRYIGITTSNNSAHAQMVQYMRTLPLDFIQVDYSLDNRAAADTVLNLAQERRIGVLVNMPLGGRRDGNLLKRLQGKPLPEMAAEFDATTWAQVLLKYVVSHPAVTCAIPGTTRLEHLKDNQAAARGRLPDSAQRKSLERWWDEQFT